MTKDKKNNEPVEDAKNTDISSQTEEMDAKKSADEAAEPDTTGEKTTIDSKDEEIKKLQEQNLELNDKFMRLFSEFDNFRKRTIKEKIDLSKTASEDVLSALLPLLDDLERAAATKISESQEEKSILTGIELILNKFRTLLNQKGVEEIKAKAMPFDTDFHEAITHMPAPSEAEKGMVLEVVQKGYLLNGKVIRFAKVVVGQ